MVHHKMLIYNKEQLVGRKERLKVKIQERGDSFERQDGPEHA